MHRDWAALDNGASVESFTGPRFYGCDPKKAFDLRLDRGWMTRLLRHTGGGPSVVVDLGRDIDITSFGMDPTLVCFGGSYAPYSLKAFQIWTKTATGSWVRAWTQETRLPLYTLSDLVPSRGTDGVRYIKLVMLSSHSGYYVGMTELTVRGAPSV